MMPSPPAARTSYGFELAQYAGKGLTLLVCDNCDNIIYPHRELCNHCLGDTISWRKIEAGATLLAQVELARSFDEWFTGHLPWSLVSVRLNRGVSLICHAHPELRDIESGEAFKVNVQVCIDAGGSGALVAMPESANENFKTLDAALNWQNGIAGETRSGE